MRLERGAIHRIISTTRKVSTPLSMTPSCTEAEFFVRERLRAVQTHVRAVLLVQAEFAELGADRIRCARRRLQRVEVEFGNHRDEGASRLVVARCIAMSRHENAAG